MGTTTEIAWANSTFNPWGGCIKVSPACKFCYAELQDKFRNWSKDGVKHWGPGSSRHIMKTTWHNPSKWDKAAARGDYRHLVFCASLADVFEEHPQLPEPREKLWELIEETPNLVWQLLTKRPENIMSMIPSRWRARLPENIWIMTSVESQEWFDRRWSYLRKVPARVHGFSCEPLLGPIDFGVAFKRMDPDRIWIITGGEHESEEHARPSQGDWFRALRDQCDERRIPFFFKQWGNYREDGMYYREYKYNVLDGRTWSNFPDGHQFAVTDFDAESAASE